LDAGLDALAGGLLLVLEFCVAVQVFVAQELFVLMDFFPELVAKLDHFSI
jgi:hypothetical protein